MDRPHRRFGYRFLSGEKVEVCSKEEGFIGSYFEASVVGYLPSGRYEVQYRNLMHENGSTPLIEVVYPGEIRPLPPRVRTSVFAVSQVVDVFQNDGWWVGEVTSRIGAVYSVYFNSTNQERQYPASQIRAHHEWVNGLWVLLQ